MHRFMFHTADSKQDNYRHSEVYPVPLQICTVATTNEEMCKYCSRIFGGESNPDFPTFILVTRDQLLTVTLSVISTLKCSIGAHGHWQ
jgi:hypothetical protein